MKRMAQSSIGYKGIGADGRPISWYYGWNPGGFGCSGGCDGCWARRMAVRAKCLDCRAFKVHTHPERLGQPAATKRPGVVLCNFTNDWLDPMRSNQEVSKFVCGMQPPHIYVTLTKNVERLAAMITPTSYQPLVDRMYNGLTIRNQAAADAKLPVFLNIKGNLWLSMEPLWGPTDILPALVWTCLGCGKTQTIPVCGCGDHAHDHRISGIIIGHDNRRGAPGTDTLDHVRSVVCQCKSAGARVYVKQLWLTPQSSGVPRLCTETREFPSDLRLRDLPWSMPKEAK